MDNWKNKLRRIVEQRQLCSCMNDTKWNELRRAMLDEMPFPPPYIIKWIYEDCKDKDFQDDVHYLGDWNEALSCNGKVHGIAIEWHILYSWIPGNRQYLPVMTKKVW